MSNLKCVRAWCLSVCLRIGTTRLLRGRASAAGGQGQEPQVAARHAEGCQRDGGGALLRPPRAQRRAHAACLICLVINAPPHLHDSVFFVCFLIKFGARFWSVPNAWRPNPKILKWVRETAAKAGACTKWRDIEMYCFKFTCKTKGRPTMQTRWRQQQNSLPACDSVRGAARWAQRVHSRADTPRSCVKARSPQGTPAAGSW